MGKKILLIGRDESIKDNLMIQRLKEEYGEDIILYTPEEAQKQGLKMEDFGNIPKLTIQAPLFKEEQVKLLGTPKDGKASRRERRAKERNKK